MELLSTKSSTLAPVKEFGDINRSTVKLTTLHDSTSEKFVEVFLAEAPMTTVDSCDTTLDLLTNDAV